MCRSRFVWAVAAVVVLTASVAAQERESPSPYFDCPYINYFDGACPQLEREKARVEPPEGDEQEAPAGSHDPDAQQDWLQEVPEELLPLFPRESLAPDTPVLYQLLLLSPTLKNARRYVRWYSRRMSRIKQAQDLIAVAGREFLAEMALE